MQQRSRPRYLQIQQIPLKPLPVNRRPTLDRRNHATLRLRNPEARRRQRISHQRRIHRRQQFPNPMPRKTRNPNRPHRQSRPRSQQIHLVQHLQHRLALHVELRQHRLHLRPLLLQHRTRRIAHMQQQLRTLHLFQRRAKAAHQRMRKVAHESHRIRQQHLTPRRQLQLPQLWIERRKHPLRLQHTRPGQRIKQRRLPRIRISHNGNRRHRHRLAPLPLLPPNPPHALKLRLDVVHANINLAAIGFQLRLARTARSNAAAGLRHTFALTRKPRQLILQLRQLDLQHTLASPRMTRENIEDQLAPIDHRTRQPRFNIPSLRRRQIMVEQHQTRASRCHHSHNLIQLSAAHQRSRIRLRPPLNQHRRLHRSSRSRQLLKLRQRRIEILFMRVPRRSFQLRGVIPQRSRGARLLSRPCQLFATGCKLHGHQHGKLLRRLLARSQERVFVHCLRSPFAYFVLNPLRQDLTPQVLRPLLQVVVRGSQRWSEAQNGLRRVH